MLKDDEKLYFRDQLRAARAIALRDAEAFEEIVFVVERLGKFLNPKAEKLVAKKAVLESIAQSSLLFEKIPGCFVNFHLPFTILFDLVRESRNDALHEGAFARHLTVHAIELSLIIEDALMSEMNLVSHFMVRNPACAYEWQPLSFIRQTMLINSFSYLPVLTETGGKKNWKLISDLAVAKYWRENRFGKKPKDSLADKLDRERMGRS